MFPAVGFFLLELWHFCQLFKGHLFITLDLGTRLSDLWKNFPPKHGHPCNCQKHCVNLSCAAKGDLRKIDALGNIMLHYATLAWTEIAVSTLRRYVSYFRPTAPVICVTSALNALHGVLSEKWTVLTEGQLAGMSGEHVLLCHMLLKSSFKRPYFALSFSLKSIYNVS